MHVWLAIKFFIRALFNPELARRIAVVADAKPAAVVPSETAAQPAAPSRQARSDAVTLLAALQREARFVDMVSETLEGYSDAQIGAAARDVLRDCGKVIRRFFDLRPVVASSEGETIDLPADIDPARYRLTGNLTNQRPPTGTLVHAGWQAVKCELPEWTGSTQAAFIVAPAEIQLR